VPKIPKVGLRIKPAAGKPNAAKPKVVIPKVGLRVIALLTMTLGLNFMLRVVLHFQRASQHPYFPPRQILTPITDKPLPVITWKSGEGLVPIGDTQRDTPPALYNTYQAVGLAAMGQPPIYFSMAPITTLNALRAPWHYLLDPDGRLMTGNSLLIRPNPTAKYRYTLQILQGYGDIFLVMHWAQAPGMDAVPDISDVPKLIARGLLLHKPVYICDAWIPLRQGVNLERLKLIIINFAQTIDAQLKRS
jgi:hypothetical protein